MHLVTAVRNEGPYLLEWVLHHRNLGFDRITIFSNDNDDGSDALLAALQAEGLVDWRPQQVAPGESPQRKAFGPFSQTLMKGWSTAGDYLAIFDPDEFLVLRRHARIGDLVADLGWPGALIVQWKHFSSGGQDRYAPAPVMQRFTECPTSTRFDRHFKSVSRLDRRLFGHMHLHRPILVRNHTVESARLVIADGSTRGVLLDPRCVAPGAEVIRIEGLPVHHEVCQLNHYAVKSRQEFAWRRARGSGYAVRGQEVNRHNDRYFRQHDEGGAEDRFAADTYVPALQAAWNALPPDILRLQREIEAAHLARPWP